MTTQETDPTRTNEPTMTGLEALVEIYSIMSSKYCDFNPKWNIEEQSRWFAGWDKITAKTLYILDEINKLSLK